MITESILKINPNLEFILKNDDYDSIEWLNFDPEKNPELVPSKEEVLSLAEQLRKEKEHFLPRIKQYPMIADQLDMLWHAMDSGEIPKATEWYEKIKEVKNSIQKST